MIRALVIVLVVVCVCRVREGVYASRLRHLHLTGLRKGENMETSQDQGRGAGLWGGWFAVRDSALT